jgi:3-hydroxyacyl-CoA dehydrogenase
VTIERAGVIGAGVMGAGIAAHLANAGVPVALLDVVPGAAAAALERMRRAEPAPFMSTAAPALVTPGDLPDDATLLAGADWVVEAVVEDAAVKNGVYAGLREVVGPGCLVTSNTSTIPLAELDCDGITHFFNPPRYLRLLEVVGPPDRLGPIEAFGDERLGKTVVRCRDTPGFIANRLGGAWIDFAVSEAFARGMTVEEADALVSRAFACPKTGVFALLDVVGIDLMLLVQRSFAARLEPGDPLLGVDRPTAFIADMVAAGRTGRKGDGGFYRLDRSNGRRTKLGLDLETGEYRPSEKPRLAALEAARGGLRALIEHGDAYGAFARAVVLRTLAYAARVTPEVADSPATVDTAMETGYAWARGPFAMIDELGAEKVAAALQADGHAVPPLLVEAAATGGFGDRRRARRQPGIALLRDVKQDAEPVQRNRSAALWDVGDGVLCLEFTTRMNALDPGVIEMAVASFSLIGDRFRALVIHNEGENFSVGANIAGVLLMANTAMWDQIELGIRGGQGAFAGLKYAPFPVVGASHGLCLGGGCEILLHCDAVQAHAETYMGLVETGVGIVPGWGGCKELLLRATARATAGGPMPPVQEAFETIGLARVSRSAAEARELGFLRDGDRITMNRDRLLADARRRALELADGYRPPEPRELVLPGPAGAAAMRLAVHGLALTGQATPHDVVVTAELARVLSGGDADVTTPVPEQALFDLERSAVVALLRTEPTLDRMEHMLTTGKPLRN